MKRFLIAAALAIGTLFGAHVAHATCPVPNPNLSFPLMDGCAIPAATLNAWYTAFNAAIGNQAPLPQGRLVAETNSCTGALPNQVNDITAATVICYVPYEGNAALVNGTFAAFSTLTMTLNSGKQTSGHIYDLFLVYSSSALHICTDGTAWSTNTTRSDAIASTNGIYTNTPSMAHCWNGLTDYGTVAAHAGVYVGSVYATANGVTQWILSPTPAAGGTNNVVGLYNAYHQILTESIERDSTPIWDYGINGTNGWVEQDNSALNRITYIDGLGLNQVLSVFSEAQSSSAIGSVWAGSTVVCFDCTTPGTYSQIGNQSAESASNQGSTPPAFGHFSGIGLHYLQALENTNSDQTFFGNTFGGMLAQIRN